LGNGNVPDTVKLIKSPTLVMVGEKSMDFMHQSAGRIAELVPNAERKTIKGQAHQAAPEIIGPLLIEFFSERT
jgi:pimeloyl-ACP methyl ester carboxylesterase